MNKPFITYSALITPLGNTPEGNFAEMKSGKSGVQVANESGFNKENWPLGRITNLNASTHRYTRLLEQACESLISTYGKELLSAPQTGIIISSTKGELDDLPGDSFESTRNTIQTILNTSNAPVVISNACISGVLAINTAADFVETERYENVFVIGLDALSDFVVYGFQSLFALSAERCRPFDEARKGISIGEAVGVVLVSKEPHASSSFNARYLGGSSSNDANHISGPSRTGEGLVRSVRKTFNRSNVSANEIDFISAHGTGTNYNDEMESIAFDRLEMAEVPLNSMKGFFGHTLGASGVIEVIASLLMMKNNLLIPSLGFETQGTSRKINVLKENTEKEVRTILKTGSGFGGGNASLIIQKES